VNKHKGMTRGFSHLSKAWYGAACLNRESIVDSITMGFYDPSDGGTTGEFSIKWDSSRLSISALHLINDSWDALYQFSDVLKRFSEIDDENYTPDKIALILIDCGIEDLTKTENPYNKKPIEFEECAFCGQTMKPPEPNDAGGEWLDVPEKSEGLSVHLGEALETQSSRNFVATPHELQDMWNHLDAASKASEKLHQIAMAGKEEVIKALHEDIRYYRKDWKDQMIQDQGTPPESNDAGE